MDESSEAGSRISIPTAEEIEQLNDQVKYFQTPRGYQMSYYEYGTPDGLPMIYLHGTGSHVHVMSLHKPAMALGFRVIAPDRPGVGRSDYQANWRVLDFADDLGALADHLGLDRFGLGGISGAGPTLMASAYRLADRLECVIDTACAMPVYRDAQMRRQLGFADRMYAMMGPTMPLWMFRIPFGLLGFMQKVMRSPQSFAKMFDASLCESDKQIFALEQMQYMFMRDFQELFRGGTRGPARDAQNVYKDWGFDLSQVTTRIDVYHGSADKFVPITFSEYLKKTAPNVRLHVTEGHGHFYLLAHGYEFLTAVKADCYSDPANGK